MAILIQKSSGNTVQEKMITLFPSDPPKKTS